MNNDRQSVKGLSLYMSNNMETLADICAMIMSEYPLRDPFTHEKAVVMNLGMGTFLSQRIAVQNDIFCLCDYPQVWQFIYETHRLLNPDAPRQDLFDREHMTWNIFSQIKLWYSNEPAVDAYGARRDQVLSAGSAARDMQSRSGAADSRSSDLSSSDDLGSDMSGDEGHDRGPGSIYYRLRRYLDDDVYGDKAYKLSAKIADTLDQYQMYRPRWILEWNRIPLSAFDDYENDPDDISNPVNLFIEEECRRFVREKSGVNSAIKKARDNADSDDLDIGPLGQNLVDGEDALADGVDNTGGGLELGKSGEHVSAERVDRVRNLFRNNVWQIKLWCTLRYNLNLLSSDDIVPNDQQSEKFDWLLHNLDRSQIMNNLIKRLRETKSFDHVEGMYERIFVFGVSSLQRVVIEFLDALALHCSVNVMLLNPCREYWADIAPRHRNDFDEYVQMIQQSTHSIHDHKRKLKVKKNYLEVPALNLSLSSYDNAGERVEGHPLLLSYGRQGRDNLYMFFDRDPVPDNISCFSEPDVKEEFESQYAIHNHQTVEEVSGGNLLAFIQKQLLELEQHPSRYLIADDDRSFSVHSCHTRRREVEVLHDALLELFNRAAIEGEELYPRDIVVMVPAINEYAPHISAVFGGSFKEGNKDYIPFVISDRTETEANPVGQALLRLLEIGTVRITSALVLELLSEEAISRRFGLERDDVDVIARWINESNIFWGLDDEDASKLSEVNIPGTFEQGMDRMILGSMLGDSNVMPCYSEIEGMDAVTLGRFWDFIQALRELRSYFTPELSLSPETWSKELRDMLTSRFFDDSEETEKALTPVHNVVESLKTVFGHLDHQPSINLPVFAATLREGLTSERNFRPFLREKVNFCSLVPMRAVPFKHVFILGLNDHDFPREERAPGFNLISSNELFERGDRSRSIDDRFLFLEAILSARKSLYLSYIGQSPVDRTVLNPSIVLDELLYYVCDSCALKGFENVTKGRRQSMVLDRILIREHLNSYNQGNYTAPSWSERKQANSDVPARLSDLKVPSFNRGFIMTDGISRHSAPMLADGIFFPEAADSSSVVLDLRTLSQFIRKPSDYFVRNLLRIRLDNSNDASVREDENFSMDRFDSNIIVNEMLRLKEEDRENYLQNKARLGGMPYGIFKNRLLTEIADRSTIMTTALKENFNISSYSDIELMQCGNREFQLTLPRSLFDGVCPYPLLDLARMQESSLAVSPDPQSGRAMRESMLSDNGQWVNFVITLQAAAMSRPVLADPFKGKARSASASGKAQVEAVPAWHDTVSLTRDHKDNVSTVMKMTVEAVAQYLYDSGLRTISMVDNKGNVFTLDSFNSDEMAVTINMMLIAWLAGQAAPFPCMASLNKKCVFQDGVPVVVNKENSSDNSSFDYDTASTYLYGDLDSMLSNRRLMQLSRCWLDYYLTILAPKFNAGS